MQGTEVRFLRSVPAHHRPAPLMAARFLGLLLPAHPASLRWAGLRAPLRREDIAILVDEHNIVTDAKTGERSALTANIVFKSIVAAY